MPVDANARPNFATSAESNGKIAPATFGRKEICSAELSKSWIERSTILWLPRNGSIEWYKCSESFEKIMSAAIPGAGRNKKAISGKDSGARSALHGTGSIYSDAAIATSWPAKIAGGTVFEEFSV